MKRIIASFGIVFVIVLVFEVSSFSQPPQKPTKAQEEESSLTRNELIQLRMQTLLQEINSHKPGQGSRFLHKWQLRLLLLSLIVGYLVLRTQGDASNIRPKGWGWIAAIVIFVASLTYDAHLAALEERVSDRLDSLYQQLYSLPTLENQQLIDDFHRVPSVRNGMESMCDRWALRLKKVGNLDSFLFSVVVVSLWVIAFYGINYTNPNQNDSESSGDS